MLVGNTVGAGGTITPTCLAKSKPDGKLIEISEYL